VNFVHDQVLVEVPAGSELAHHAAEVRRWMTEGMRAVVPDVKVGVKVAATDRWYKDAEPVYDEAKEQLLLWHPEESKLNRL
jgi:hypothetical protein